MDFPPLGEGGWGRAPCLGAGGRAGLCHLPAPSFWLRALGGGACRLRTGCAGSRKQTSQALGQLLTFRGCLCPEQPTLQLPARNAGACSFHRSHGLGQHPCRHQDETAEPGMALGCWATMRGSGNQCPVPHWALGSNPGLTTEALWLWENYLVCLSFVIYKMALIRLIPPSESRKD